MHNFSLDLEAYLGRKLILLDGAMGTSLQALGLSPGVCPESWNLGQPDKVSSVHLAYLQAGAQVIETNTFGANRLKLSQYGLAEQVDVINQRGAALARQAIADFGRDNMVWVAGVIGPLGQLMEPYGSLSVQAAWVAFREQATALVKAGVDLILVQTMSDLAEARQAVLAAKGLGVPVWCSVTFEPSGHTLTGASPEAAVVSLSAAGATVVGANCSLGPAEMVSVISRMVSTGLVPILAEPNAGLPQLHNGRTIFPTHPVEFASGLSRLVKAGAAVVGGCCGTTATHITACSKLTELDCQPMVRERGLLHLASRTEHIAIGAGQPVRLIGERLNPTGRKKLASDISAGAFVEVAREARQQTGSGAELLDVNVGVAGIDQIEAITKAVPAVERASLLPLVLDSATPAVLRAGASVYQGKALLNSVTAKRASLEAVLPIAKEYGAAVIGLTITEQGIPERASERLAAAKLIVKAALSYGIDPSDIIIDCLTLTIGAQPEAARETLEAIRLVKKELGVTTVLGVSNISHGLPNRTVLNDAFLAMAVSSGLDAAIINPLVDSVRATLTAGSLLAGRDPGARRYIAVFGGEEPGAEVFSKLPAGGGDEREALLKSVVSGDRDGVEPAITALLKAAWEPLAIINQLLTPALEEVGIKYENGEYFLPNLLLSAEAAQKAFAIIKAKFPADERGVIGRALLATVEGDIHDIGKNIVKVILENHGFITIDLGKDVPVADIVRAAHDEQVDIVLLSALMTTTLPAMAQTVERLHQVAPGLPVLVGGAVVTASYAKEIGAAGYAKDAVSGVNEAKRLIRASKGEK